MKIRVLVGVVLVLLLIAVFAFGLWFRAAVFTAAALISVYEMVRAFRARGYHPCAWPLYGLAATYWLAFLPVVSSGLAYLRLLLLVWPLALCTERVFNPKRTTEDAICSLFVCVYPLAFYVMLSVVARVSSNLLLLCFTGPLMGDTLAYFVGSAFGKHKLCPHISPKKTLEGSIAGFLGGALGGLLAWGLHRLQIPGISWGWGFTLPPMLIAGFVCGGVGQIGDLFASTIKRWASIKDYGSIFPGHGGMLDRLDSVLMCAPAVFICMPIFIHL